VPGAGPGLSGKSWSVAKHPQHRRRKTPYLTDNVELGRAFRDAYLKEMRRMLRNGTLKIGGSVAFLKNEKGRKEFFDQLESIDWNVFIQGPPKGRSDPANVVKYLAGYMTGGPIADSRVISADNDEVWIKARPKQSSKKKRGMNAPRPYRLSARQFMQRWAMHVLPKGFTRSRAYGGYHGSKRQAYLARCRELLPPEQSVEQYPAPDQPPSETVTESRQRPCPKCNGELALLRSERRPSWRTVFEKVIYRIDDCLPVHQIGIARAPPGRSP